MRYFHRGSRGRRFSVVGGSIALLTGVAATWSLVLVGPASALPAGCVQVTSTVTCTFHSTGAEQKFVVPLSVTRIHVTAVGGTGGSGSWNDGADEPAGAGGLGAAVSETVPVKPGATLYVEVAGNGANGTFGAGGAGGFNGGGNGATLSSSSSGGGGGASDVRTTSCGGTCPGQPASLASRLIVAAGGGGGGTQFNGGAPAAGAGGAAGGSPHSGGPGADSPAYPGSGGKGGGAGTASQFGAGGAAGNAEADAPDNAGTDGSSGQGGSGDVSSLYTQEPGGGGGGGYYGGGGGGSGGFNSGDVAGGGGGGAGSSFVSPSATSTSIGSDATGVPLITISYSTSQLASPCTAKGTSSVLSNTGVVSVSGKGTGTSGRPTSCTTKLTGRWAKNSPTFSFHAVGGATLGNGGVFTLNPKTKMSPLTGKVTGTYLGPLMPAGSAIWVEVDCGFTYPPMKLHCTIIIHPGPLPTG